MASAIFMLGQSEQPDTFTTHFPLMETMPETNEGAPAAEDTQKEKRKHMDEGRYQHQA